VHRKLMPGNPQARACSSGSEQARVEALGSRRMAGVAKNLTADARRSFHRGKFDEITDRADAPLSDAAARDAGARTPHRMAPPAAARKMVDLWRPVLEDKIGGAARPARPARRGPGEVCDAVHDLLTALELGDDRNAEADDDENQDDNREGENDQSAPRARPIPTPARK